MPTRKYYTVNPSWFHGYGSFVASQVVIFGEDTDKAVKDSCLAICWYPTGPKLDADFDEWLFLDQGPLLGLLAAAGQIYGKDLAVEQVVEILENCGFEEEQCIPNPVNVPDLLIHDPRVGKKARCGNGDVGEIVAIWRHADGTELFKVTHGSGFITSGSNQFEIVEED
jgi:hypothetical protein